MKPRVNSPSPKTASLNFFGKPRKGQQLSRLWLLPAEQREELERWLFRENQTYAEVQARLSQRFGVNVSKNALCRFFQKRTEVVQEKAAATVGEIRLGIVIPVGSDGPIKVVVKRSGSAEPETILVS